MEYLTQMRFLWWGFIYQQYSVYNQLCYQNTKRMGTQQMLQYKYVVAKLSLNIKNLNLINKDRTQ